MSKILSLYFFSFSLSLTHSFRFFNLAWQPRPTAAAVDCTQQFAKGKAAATTTTLTW